MRRALATVSSALGIFAAMNLALASTIAFDQDTPGAAPAGWRCGVTGRGSPKWVIEADATAPSKPTC
jgi:hypothetical protein